MALYCVERDTPRRSLPSESCRTVRGSGGSFAGLPREQWAEQSFPSTPHRTPSVIGADERPLDQRQREWYHGSLTFASPVQGRSARKSFCYPPKLQTIFKERSICWIFKSPRPPAPRPSPRTRASWASVRFSPTTCSSWTMRRTRAGMTPASSPISPSPWILPA